MNIYYPKITMSELFPLIRDYKFLEYIKSSPGVFFVIDSNFNIIHFQTLNNSYTQFKNHSDDLSDLKYFVGKNIINLIKGQDVKDYYKKVYTQMFDGSLDNYHFNIKDDSSDIKRNLQLIFSPIKLDGEVQAVVHHCLVSSKNNRPSMDFLRPNNHDESYKLLSICSVCGKVKHNGNWIKPKNYYLQGGSEKVNLTHGFCKPCYQQAKELLNNYRTQ